MWPAIYLREVPFLWSQFSEIYIPCCLQFRLVAWLPRHMNRLLSAWSGPSVAIILFIPVVILINWAKAFQYDSLCHVLLGWHFSHFTFCPAYWFQDACSKHLRSLLRALCLLASIGCSVTGALTCLESVTRFLLEWTTLLATNSERIRSAQSDATCIAEICIKLCMGKVYGARGSVVVKALCYKPEGRGFDSR
jgi:hypothetical protein